MTDSNPFGMPDELVAQIRAAMDQADLVLSLPDEELIADEDDPA